MVPVSSQDCRVFLVSQIPVKMVPIVLLYRIAHFHAHVHRATLEARVNQILACRIHVKTMPFAHRCPTVLFLARVHRAILEGRVNQILAC